MNNPSNIIHNIILNMDLRGVLCDLVNRCVAEINDGDDIKGPIKEKILKQNSMDFVLVFINTFTVFISLFFYF